jgi:hypothetical protein
MWLRNKASYRGSEISESKYRSETDAARAAQFQAGPYETHRQRRLWLYAADSSCRSGQPALSSWRVHLKLWQGSDPKSTGIAAASCGLDLGGKVAAPRLAGLGPAVALDGPAGKAPRASSALQGTAIAKVGFCRKPAFYLPVAGSRTPEMAL